MIYYAAVPLTVFVVVLQIAGVPSFTAFGVHPDLPVVWLGCWAVLRGRSAVLPLILTAGLALGLLGPEPLGASVLGLIPIAATPVVDDAQILPNRFLLALGVVFVAGTVYVLVQAAAAYVGGEPLGGALNLLRVAPRVGMLDAVVAVLWYWPMRLLLPRRQRGGAFRRA
ncbi:MAG: hypothetical protein ACYDCQ_07030 [Dehalococcoidia bacterium]